MDSVSESHLQYTMSLTLIPVLCRIPVWAYPLTLTTLPSLSYCTHIPAPSLLSAGIELKGAGGMPRKDWQTNSDGFLWCRAVKWWNTTWSYPVDQSWTEGTWLQLMCCAPSQSHCPIRSNGVTMRLCGMPLKFFTLTTFISNQRNASSHNWKLNTWGSSSLKDRSPWTL